jgi:hypothetical protein
MLETLESPPDGGWTDKEIETFSRRAERFAKAGMETMDAEKLAEQMLYRDRPDSGDDRRICVECRAFVKGRCTSGVIAPWNILQRCDGFAMRGTA